MGSVGRVISGSWVNKTRWVIHTGHGHRSWVIDHVTIRFAICRFFLVALWNRASIPDGFRDICIQIGLYLVHDFDQFRWRDFIRHYRCHFLCVTQYNTMWPLDSWLSPVYREFGLLIKMQSYLQELNRSPATNDISY